MGFEEADPCLQGIKSVRWTLFKAGGESHQQQSAVPKDCEMLLISHRTSSFGYSVFYGQYSLFTIPFSLLDVDFWKVISYIKCRES